MSMACNKTAQPKYKDGRTKQAFKDECDVNKIIARAQREGGIAHAQKYDKAVYGEFADYDLLTAFNMVEKANTIFADLPSEVRKEFNGDAFAFAAWASMPENADKLSEKIPALAQPGRQLPNPVKRGGTGAAAATAASEPGESGEVSPTPDNGAEAPPEASGAASDSGG